MNSIDWNDVLYFLVLSRHASVSAAARALKVQHSTVARRITSLEEALDVKLFNRMATGWVLTAEGQELANRAALLESDIYSFQRFALKKPTHAGKVRLSAPPLLMSEVITPRLGSLLRNYPDLDLELVGETRIADLLRGEADIAIRMTEPGSLEYVARLLCDVHYDLYGAAGWTSVSPEKRVFIGFNEGALTDTHLSQKTLLDAHVGRRSYTLRTNDARSSYRAALSGFGIALLPRFLGRECDELCRIDGLSEPIAFPAYLVMHRDIRRIPRVRLVADFLIDLFGKQGWQ